MIVQRSDVKDISCLMHGQPPCRTKAAPSCRWIQVMCPAPQRSSCSRATSLYDAALVVCEGLDALDFTMMNIRRPSLSFNPPNLADQISLFAHAYIGLSMALIMTVHTALRQAVSIQFRSLMTLTDWPHRWLGMLVYKSIVRAITGQHQGRAYCLVLLQYTGLFMKPRGSKWKCLLDTITSPAEHVTCRDRSTFCTCARHICIRK